MNFFNAILIGLLTFQTTCNQNQPKVNERVPGKNKVEVQKLDGVYVGLTELCDVDSTGKKDCIIDPSTPDREWYHLSYLTIKGDSAFMDQYPISISQKTKDTLYSASDGGFFYYKGHVEQENSLLKLDLTLTSCDHCGMPVRINPDGSKSSIIQKSKFAGKKLKDGLALNGSFYKKTNKASIH